MLLFGGLATGIIGDGGRGDGETGGGGSFAPEKGGGVLKRGSNIGALT